MVTPAFSQAWIRAAPAISHQQQHHHHHRAPARRTLDRDLLSICPQSASTSAGSGMPMAAGSSQPTDCELDLGGPLGCCRKGARGHAGLSASPPSRTGQRVPQHRCRRDGRGCRGEIGVGSRGARTGSLSFSSDAFAVVVMDVVPSQPTHPEEPGALPPSLGPPIRPRSW